ncbi:MAG: Flp pilus assembly protein CpaB [Phycisphaerae bacterium]|nr:Flp pilus assembly protein CpaB [Phycisphaerae bacterium]
MKPTTVLPIVVGLAAAVVALNYFSQKPPPPPTYIVAIKPIAANQAVTQEMISWKEWREGGALPSDYIRIPDQLISRFASRTIEAGRPITEADLHQAGVTSLMMAKLENDPDMRMAVIRVDDVSGGGGFVRAGNRVDILATNSKDNSCKAILQGIEVLAVNRMETSNPSDPKSQGKGSVGNEPVRQISLLLTLKESEIIKAAEATSGVKLHVLLSGPNARRQETVGATLTDALGLARHDDAQEPEPVKMELPPPPPPVVVKPVDKETEKAASGRNIVLELVRGKKHDRATFHVAPDGAFRPVVGPQAPDADDERPPTVAASGDGAQSPEPPPE